MPKILPDLKENLLREVERLLDRGGYGAVTIRAVATGCGVSVGTVYNYFPSKEDMLAEYLLVDWRAAVAAIEEAAATAEDPEPVARCIHEQLLAYAHTHRAVFQAEAAQGSFAGSFSPYHTLLRRQLAHPLERFCSSAFASEFIAEALLTWTVAGKEFCEIWGMLRPLFYNPI